MRALPLAAGINVGGHYFRYYSTLVVVLIAFLKIPEGVVVGWLGGWGKIEIKAKLSPARAGAWAELANIKIVATYVYASS